MKVLITLALAAIAGIAAATLFVNAGDSKFKALEQSIEGLQSRGEIIVSSQSVSTNIETQKPPTSILGTNVPFSESSIRQTLKNTVLLGFDATGIRYSKEGQLAKVTLPPIKPLGLQSEEGDLAQIDQGILSFEVPTDAHVKNVSETKRKVMLQACERNLEQAQEGAIALMTQLFTPLGVEFIVEIEKTNSCLQE